MAKHRYTAEEVAEWRKTHGSFFYYNTDDSNPTAPKAAGFGRTFNWAHPLSWVLTAAILAVLAWSLFLR